MKGFIVTIICSFLLFPVSSSVVAAKSVNNAKPVVKVVSYQKQFRRNSSKLVEHLSLVIYFSEQKGQRTTYQVMYELVDNSGNVYLGVEKYLDPRPCAVGYTGQSEILECPLPTFKEITLKSRQQRKPASVRGLVQDGDWWITKGFEYPSFKSSEYKVSRVKIYNQDTQELIWDIR